MAISYQETDTDAAITPATDLNKTAEDGGTAGTAETQVKVNAGATEEAIAFVANPASGVSWDAGDTTARVDVSTADTTSEIREVYVRRYNSSGVLQETLGSLTGLTEDLTAGVHSHTITISAATSPADTDRFVVVYLLGSTASHGNSSVGITPSQVIDTPLSAGAQSFTQTLTATTSNSAAISRKTATTKSASVSAIPSITKKSTKGLSATVGASAALTTGLSFKQALAASVSAVATLSPKAVITQVLSVTTSNVVGLSKKIGKRIGAAVSAGASLTRKTSKSLNATVSASPSLSKVTSKTLGVVSSVSATLTSKVSLSQALSSVVSAVAALATEFTAGGGGGDGGGNGGGGGSDRGLIQRAMVSRIRGKDDSEMISKT